jgi:hypothetical protein
MTRDQRRIVRELGARGYRVRIIRPGERRDGWSAVVLTRGRDVRRIVAAEKLGKALEQALQGGGGGGGGRIVIADGSRDVPVAAVQTAFKHPLRRRDGERDRFPVLARSRAETGAGAPRHADLRGRYFVTNRDQPPEPSCGIPPSGERKGDGWTR